MDGKTMKELRAEARGIVADYDPDCDQDRYEDVVAKLAALGARMTDASVDCGARP